MQIFEVVKCGCWYGLSAFYRYTGYMPYLHIHM